MRDRQLSTRSRGFSLVELLIVFAVLSLLMMLLLPAIQMSRERARNMHCMNNLMQIGLALANYNQVHRVLPPGCVNATGPVLTDATGYKLSWIVQILPFMGEHAVYAGVDFVNPQWSFLDADARQQFHDSIGARPKSTAPQTLRKPDGLEPSADNEVMSTLAFVTKHVPESPATRVRGFDWYTCPSDPGGGGGGPDYVGVHNSTEIPIDVNGDGLLYLNSSESLEAIPDGRSTTLLLCEAVPSTGDRGWFYGDRSTLRNGGRFAKVAPNARGVQSGAIQDFSNLDEQQKQELLSRDAFLVGTFSSYHSYNVNCCLADGSVRSLNWQIDQTVLQRLISRHDGQVVSTGEF